MSTFVIWIKLVEFCSIYNLSSNILNLIIFLVLTAGWAFYAFQMIFGTRAFFEYSVHVGPLCEPRRLYRRCVGGSATPPRAAGRALRAGGL